MYVLAHHLGKYSLYTLWYHGKQIVNILASLHQLIWSLTKYWFILIVLSIWVLLWQAGNDYTIIKGVIFPFKPFFIKGVLNVLMKTKIIEKLTQVYSRYSCEKPPPLPWKGFLLKWAKDMFKW